MADEAKKGCGCAIKLNSLLKLILGVLVILLGVGLTVKYFWALRLIIAGGLGPFLILVGLVIVAVSKE